MTAKEDEVPKQQAQQAQDTGRRCPNCAAFPRLSFQFLDPRSGRTVRLYECLCGERLWDD